MISQDVRDLLEDPHGRAIAANAAAALLPPQNDRTIDAVAAAFGLGAGERALLLGAQVGEALLVAGRARRAVRVLVMPELDPLITTDPAALLRARGPPALGADPTRPSAERRGGEPMLRRRPEREDPAVLKRRYPIEEVVARAGVAPAPLRRRAWSAAAPSTTTARRPSPSTPTRRPTTAIGCGAHGDVFAFIMARERCSFRRGDRAADRRRPPPGAAAAGPRRRAGADRAPAGDPDRRGARLRRRPGRRPRARRRPGHRAGARRRRPRPPAPGATACGAPTRRWPTCAAGACRDDVLGPALVGWCEGDRLAAAGGRATAGPTAELVELGLLDERRARAAGRPRGRARRCAPAAASG